MRNRTWCMGPVHAERYQDEYQIVQKKAEAAS